MNSLFVNAEPCLLHIIMSYTKTKVLIPDISVMNKRVVNNNTILQTALRLLFSRSTRLHEQRTTDVVLTTTTFYLLQIEQRDRQLPIQSAACNIL